MRIAGDCFLAGVESGAAVSEVTTVKCDFCGQVKQEANHWWRLGVDPDLGILFLCASVAVPRAIKGTPKDACGSQCVQLGVARFLVHGTLEEK